MQLRYTSAIVLSAILALAAMQPARADEVEQVSVNTAAANVGGPNQAELIFTFLDGSSLGDGNNTATLSDLSFGTGASLDPAVDTPNLLGTLDTTLSLTDSLFDSSIGILFNPGVTVSFQLDLTTNVDVGGTPDSFSFVMFDTNNNIVATADPTGADTILNVALDGANTSSFSDPNFATVTPVVSATPEPGTLLLFVTGLFAFGLLRRRRLA